MADPNPPAHGTTTPTARPPLFPPAQLEQLREDDRKAAAYVVGLMIGIFILGLVGYLGVCFWVA